EERRRLNETAKKRIAQACAGAIPDGASVFLNIGTTTEAVARALLGHRRLMVVTNNLNAAEILSASPECEITLTGGRLRSEDGGLVGPLAARSVDQFRFDVAVLGCSALDAGGDLLDFDPQEVMVSQSALHRARRRLVVADRSKLRRPAPIRICSLAEIDALYTDAPLPEALAAQCDGWDTAIVPPDPA
ncbi:DeoR/GlpR family DNA-binding transcription regulator, partial [Shimia sp.]|uniref:DeoR/GlpR family DNA-binding transcription regulator n=1 Tax=Shimia sp. TaxID=1954381 RepID=UPI00356410DC